MDRSETEGWQRLSWQDREIQTEKGPVKAVDALPQERHAYLRDAIDYATDFLRECWKRVLHTDSVPANGCLRPANVLEAEAIRQDLQLEVHLESSSPLPPPICYAVTQWTREVARGSDVAWWYYRNLIRSYNLEPGDKLQQDLWRFIDVLAERTRKRLEERMVVDRVVSLEAREIVDELLV